MLESQSVFSRVVFCDPDLGLVHVLEAALIDMFHQVAGCRNAGLSGGEGSLKRKDHVGPPIYILRRVGYIYFQYFDALWHQFVCL